MENETDYNRVFYYMYTLLNRKKIFLQYIEYYSNLKQLDRQECTKTMEEYKNTKGIIY